MRGDEDFCGDIRAFVERNEAYHELHFSLVAVDDALDEGIEGSAGFAGWIKKLDDADLGLWGAVGRRVRAIENGTILLRKAGRRLGLFVEVAVYAKRESEQDYDPAENDGELFVGHCLESFFAASRSSTMMEKAISDKSGMVMKPTNSSFCAEQDSPLPQGCRVAGMNPP